MPTSTPYYGWTIPDDSDKLEAIIPILQSGLKDAENTFHVATDAKVASAPSTAYPLGISLMTLTGSGATAGEWPEHISSLVLTLRRTSAEAATQFWMSTLNTTPRLRIRSADPSGWSGWRVVAGPGQARASYASTATFVNANQPRTQTVAIPAGLFTATPTIVATPHDRDVVVRVTGKSTTGFTMLIGANGGGDTFPAADYLVDWIAMENS